MKRGNYRLDMPSRKQLLIWAFAVAVAYGLFAWAAGFVVPAINGDTTHAGGEPYSTVDHLLSVGLGLITILIPVGLAAGLPLRFRRHRRFTIVAVAGAAVLGFLAVGLVLIGGFVLVAPAVLLLLSLRAESQ